VSGGFPGFGMVIIVMITYYDFIIICKIAVMITYYDFIICKHGLRYNGLASSAISVSRKCYATRDCGGNLSPNDFSAIYTPIILIKLISK